MLKIKSNKAQVSMYIVFWITLVFIIVIAAVLAPVGVQFNTQIYEAGESPIRQNNSTIQLIDDADARSRIQSMNDEALAATSIACIVTGKQIGRAHV